MAKIKKEKLKQIKKQEKVVFNEENPKFHSEKSGCIAILSGCISDLSKIDFSDWGLKCYNINSPELKKFIKKHSEKVCYENNLRLISEESKKDILPEERKYLNVLVPIDFKKPPSERDIYDCRLALLVLFPSEITVYIIYRLQIFDGKYFYGAGSTHYEYNPFKYGKPYEQYLIYDEDRFTEINDYMKLYKERSKIKYIRTALRFYEMAWIVNHPEMSFVCLCIALEGIVPGSEQLSYRFRRNLAVLCGQEKYYSEYIYRNAKKLYEFRSKIVHSSMESKDYKFFEDYFNYAKALASRMIVEMILHNIPTIVELDYKLSTLGFGDQSKISSNYKQVIGNILSYTDIFIKKLYDLHKEKL